MERDKKLSKRLVTAEIEFPKNQVNAPVSLEHTAIIVQQVVGILNQEKPMIVWRDFIGKTVFQEPPFNGLLREFLMLHGDTDQRILKFAQKWGCLTLQRIPLPSNEDLKNISHVENPFDEDHYVVMSDEEYESIMDDVLSAKEGDLVEEGDPADEDVKDILYAESMEDYRLLSRYFAAVLGLTADISKADISKERDLSAGDWKVIREHPAAPRGVHIRKTYSWAKVSVSTLLTHWLNEAGLVPVIEWYEHPRITLEFSPYFGEVGKSELFRALVIQLVQTVMSPSAPFRCGICNRVAVKRDRSPRKGTTPLCGSDTCKRENDRLRQARHRRQAT